jgi:hypothetical protein
MKTFEQQYRILGALPLMLRWRVSRVLSRATHRVLVLIIVSLCILACSGGPGGSDDAATDAPDVDDGIEIEGPTPPEPPAPPVFTPCPDGWREVEDPDTGVVTCDPWPEGGPEECGPDEAHFPGEPGCVRIGTACPTGDWADDLPTDRTILYVRAGEPGGGDGTIGSPFGTIADAMAVADPTDVVALSKGTFDEVVILRPAVTLWGACVAETVVTNSVPAEMTGTIIVTGSETRVRNLSVTAPRPGIWVQGESRSILIEDVLVHHTVKYGVRVMQGWAIMRNVAVRDVVSDGDGRFGRGLIASLQASVEVDRAVFERNRDMNVAAFDAGTSIVMQDVSISDTLCVEVTGDFGVGLQVQDGAHAELVRGTIEKSRGSGIQAAGIGASIDLADVVVRDTLGWDVSGDDGRGLGIQRGARAHVDRCLFERNRLYGIYAYLPGTMLEATDVLVRDTQRSPGEADNGMGLAVYGGARCIVTRAMFERNYAVGVYAEGEGTELAATDVTVSDTLSQVDSGALGYGLAVSQGARADVVRGLFERNTAMSVCSLYPGSLLVMVDAIVRDTQSAPLSGLYGKGLVAGAGGRVEVDRGLIERSRSVGIAVHWENSVAILTDVTVVDTLERACAVDTCAGFGSGVGVGAYGGGYLEATRFLISRSALSGVQVGHGADEDGERSPLAGIIDLHAGEVSYNPVGVNVQDAEYDIERLMDGVVYHDNDTNLDMSELPVPDVDVEL